MMRRIDGQYKGHDMQLIYLHSSRQLELEIQPAGLSSLQPPKKSGDRCYGSITMARYGLAIGVAIH